MTKKESAPFHQTNQGQGDFKEGSGETVMKAAAPKDDPILVELRALREELATSQAEIVPLLKRIAENTGPKPSASSRRTNGTNP